MDDGKRCRKHQNSAKVAKKMGKSKTQQQEEQRKEGAHLKGRIENYGTLKPCMSDRDEGDGESVPDSPSEDKESPVAENDKSQKNFNVSIELDVMAVILFVCGVATRMYRLEEPRSIVFDELHYGKYVSLYMKRIFFFDAHPPLGKQLVAVAAYLAGFDGNFKFDRIGREYEDSVPLFALRFVPALCGSLLMPVVYHLMIEMGVSHWTAALAGFLLLCDNALLTQSRFILMESMLLLFALFGLLCILKFRHYSTAPYCVQWWLWLIMGSVSLTCALCVKYVGFFSCSLAMAILAQDYWKLLGNRKLSDSAIVFQLLARLIVVIGVPVAIYLGIFYAHLSVLTLAGPHDSVMSSAFQASLEGGLASITRGQPLEVAHGSQVTLRHSHGRTCWLHSHAHVYPIRYPDKRGSSHQQQVTCYSFKDVNNWWIVKRPLRNDLVVSQPVDAIRHGDVIQLVHGMTSRALNSHDVAAPMSPQNQEVSCYIDYNVSMPAQNLWRVDIINRDQVGDVWHTIESLVHLIHVNSSQALKFSGRQLPDWGFNQHEVVTDRAIHQDDTVWNVEEHRYTQTEDQKDRERELVNAEMIPLRATTLSFWEKFLELQYKMLFSDQENVQNHMYSSEPLEWPSMTRGIAYWVSPHSNAQVHLLGNLVVWYSGTVSLLLYAIFLCVYVLRRRRQCYDLNKDAWHKFVTIGEILLVGYLFHYIPFFFVERTLFLHHYLPAFTFKVLLTAAMVEHMLYFVRDVLNWQLVSFFFKMSTAFWLLAVFIVFRRFTVLSYGTTSLTTADILSLRWKDSWDFIVHRQ
ncbi:protein O-mannosyltransferase 1 isoform X1 [Schistocerca gregaria]|uniref:protein O-mannosyltransferase 1 isoform X1 n=1 Tax=Schistocerca gregaria TaxID=7010 RepID=UPI00211DC806|nr:protein O-mannosyltransferase 1 isoform X1 [Schistocerca gregaria]